MNKARSYAKSDQSRGAMACAFLLRAWRALLCRWNWHDDGMGTWYNLELHAPDQSVTKVGDRVVWVCAHCGSRIQHEGFATLSARREWIANPAQRRVFLREFLRDGSQ